MKKMALIFTIGWGVLLAGCSGVNPTNTTPPLGTATSASPLTAPTAVPPDTPYPSPPQQNPDVAPYPSPEGEEDATPPGEIKIGIEADADVLSVRAVEAADGTWTFHVTVAHPDTGWEDYTDGWDVVTPDGTVLKANEDDPFTRLLLHPHEAEQPFTRSQSGLIVPDGVTQLTVRAHDLVAGWGGRMLTVDLTKDQGDDFVVERSP